MKRIFHLIVFFSVCFISCSDTSTIAEFNTEHLRVSLSNKGEITGFFDKNSSVNYLPRNIPAPLMSIRIDHKILHPESAKVEKGTDIISLSYDKNIKAKIKFKSGKSHLTLELVSILNSHGIDLIVWGPYPTRIKKIIGETIGVVRGDDYAIGIQALNAKTLAGYPWNENDCMPQIDIFDQQDPSDLSESGKRYVLYRVEGAKPTEFGSTLQAYCRNRNKERVIKNWNHEKYTATPFADGGIIGSKIAIFGCPANRSLQTIGSIEVAEGLPHPEIDGKWGKIAAAASAAYIILEFGVKDIDKALEITKKAGLKYLYHPDPFDNWGHFDLKKKFFPEGIASLKHCVNQAKKEGIMLGVHTLSNFITTNDPYVTPIPDNRLARVGTTRITKEITKNTIEISIESPIFFNQYKNNHLRTVSIEGELIRYQKVSEKPPWKLLNCQRGAFGTFIKNHKKGSPISKLADHAYKVFLTNPELGMEVSRNIAGLFNKTGLRQISFDGLEGNRSTGMGNYGEILFTLNWFNHLSNEIKSHYIADASRTSHYFWHLYTRMNWGEPWYAGFRESQTDYRIKNQEYFKRNLMPGMLGWFKMTAETSIEDIEWMLARSAAFDAGYAFCTSFEILKKNQHAGIILERLGEWERVRMLKLFSSEQKERMKTIKNEFSLKTINDSEWNLYQVFSYKFKHEKKVRQPGEPAGSIFAFSNPCLEQRLNLLITAVSGNLQHIKMEIDNYKEIVLPADLTEGEVFKYSGGEKATIFDSNWAEVKEVRMDPDSFRISKGDHTITFNCKLIGGKKPQAKLELRIFSTPEKIRAN